MGFRSSTSQLSDLCFIKYIMCVEVTLLQEWQYTLKCFLSAKEITRTLWQYLFEDNHWFYMKESHYELCLKFLKMHILDF